MKRTKDALLAWARRWHYPCLWLTRTDRVKHGELHWQRLARDKARRDLAWAKIAQWNRRAGQEQGDMAS